MTATFPWSGRLLGSVASLALTLATFVTIANATAVLRSVRVSCICFDIIDYGPSRAIHLSDEGVDLPCFPGICLPPRVHLIRPRILVPVITCPPDPGPEALCEVTFRREPRA